LPWCKHVCVADTMATLDDDVDLALELQLEYLKQNHLFTHISVCDVFRESVPRFMDPARTSSSDLSLRLRCDAPDATVTFIRDRSPTTGDLILVLDTIAVWPSRRRQGTCSQFLDRLATEYPSCIIDHVMTDAMRATLRFTGRWEPVPDGGKDWRVKDAASRK